MALRESIRLAAESEIDAEAARDVSAEVGCSSGIEYHFDGPRGAFSGYTVTVTTDRGLTKTFPRVDATEKPDAHQVHVEYAEELIMEIRKRRQARLLADKEIDRG